MKLVCLCLAAAYLMSAQEKALQPRVREVIEAVSEERIAATINKLASFPTRNTLSSEGIAAARQWILEEFQSYSPRLQVSLEQFKVKKNDERIFRDVDLYNVVAVLPGKSMPESRVLVTGHYDSLNLIPKPASSTEQEAADNAAERTTTYDWTQVDVH